MVRRCEFGYYLQAAAAAAGGGGGGVLMNVLSLSRVG
jgi:hypothetical protein